MADNGEGLKSSPIAGKTDAEIALMLIDEWRQTPAIKLVMAAELAYHLVGLLQLACRHTLVSERSRELVKDFIRQLGVLGPVTAATFEQGWQAIYDR